MGGGVWSVAKKCVFFFQFQGMIPRRAVGQGVIKNEEGTKGHEYSFF